MTQFCVIGGNLYLIQQNNKVRQKFSLQAHGSWISVDKMWLTVTVVIYAT